MSKIIAIDYGKKRCGIAITDELQIIASPLTTVGPKELIPFLLEKVEQDDVSEVVLGLPTNLDQSDTHITAEVKKIFEELKSRLSSCDCVLFDERFTSKMALQSLIQTGASKKIRKNKSLLDETSAVILLQSYMASKSR